MLDWFAEKLAPMFRKREFEISVLGKSREILALQLKRSVLKGEIDQAVKSKKSRKHLYAELDCLTAEQLRLEAK